MSARTREVGSPDRQIPMRIPLFKVHMPPRDRLMPQLETVLYSGQIGEGEVVKQFEAAFGRFVGNPNALSFASGTAALHTALILAGVGPGDDVISTAMTAEPTNMAVLHAGATPVWADVDPDSGNVVGGVDSSIASPIGRRRSSSCTTRGVPVAIGRDPRNRGAARRAGHRGCRPRAGRIATTASRLARTPSTSCSRFRPSST